MAENSLSPEVMVAATKSLLAFVQNHKDDGSEWMQISDLNWMRIDAFDGSIKATVYAINDFGVVDLSSAVVITHSAEQTVSPRATDGEIDIDKAAQRYQALVKMGDVGVRREAWRFMRSGDTLIGMDFEQVVQFVLGWEIQLYPENFWKEVNGVRDVHVPDNNGGGLV